ncbi:3'(2'),5'-bisphosphate nucleotidase CysQ [Marivita sp. GX14005]|uniref:3'(2'),5'-bisphosphate nucleotidase CysQ n=1 Tax=Marivita sp. GX14005 TaxID=2942276 RepID=UPI0032D56B18
MLDAAELAAGIALREKARGLEIEQKPGGAGPVTQADIAVDRALHDFLRAERSEYGWLSEEIEDDPGRMAARRVFVIDPIDGTRSFINGERIWAHSLAIIENGIVIAGVVHLPEMNLLYSAETSKGAFCNDAQLRVSDDVSLGNARVLATRANMDAAHWREGAPGFKRSHRPSLAYRLCLVAQGRYDAMLTLRPTWEWDIAAGSLILSEAGATVTDRGGKPLRFNNRSAQTEGLIGAGKRLHGRIANRLVYRS